MEEAEGAGTGGGLRLEELQEIAAEAGILPGLIPKAVKKVGAGEIPEGEDRPPRDS